MATFKSTSKKSNSSSGLFKATKRKSYDSVYVSGVEDKAQKAFNTINDYIAKRKNNDWMSEDDIAVYRSALKGYTESKSALTEFEKSFGRYKEDDEKSWQEFISSVGTDMDNASETFKGFSNADDYTSYLKFAPGTDIKHRLNNYEANKTRIAEIDKQIEEAKKRQGWVGVLMNGDLAKERDRLVMENTKYERGSKKLDDYTIDLTGRSDFEEASKKRNFSNASKDESLKKSVALDESQWHFDANGVYRDAFGNEIPAEGNEWVHPMKDERLIEDPLGLFLKSTEEEKEDGINRKTAGGSSEDDEWASAMYTGHMDSWESLEPKEIDMYYYLLNTEGTNKALQYLGDLAPELNRRATNYYNTNLAKKFDEASGLEKIGLSIATIGAQFVGNVAAGVEDAVAIVTGDDINPYSAAHGGKNFSQTVRGLQAEEFNELTGDLKIPFLDYKVGDAYQAVMSFGDMATGLLSSGAYATSMGLGAGSDTATKLWEEGASIGEIASLGTIAGVAEGFFEKFSIDKLIKLGDVKTLGQFAKNIAIQGGIEASEEGLTEATNIIADSIIRGGHSEWAKLVDEYGGDEFKAFLKKAQQVGQASMSGFISGVLGGGASSAAGYAQYNSAMKEHGQGILDNQGYEDLRELAMDVAGATKTKGSKRLNQFLDKTASKPTAGNVGKLSDSLNDVRIQENKADIQKALIEKGLSKGKAKQYTDTLFAMNEQLGTDEQWAEITGDKNAYSVMREVVTDMDSSVNKRNQQHNLGRRGFKATEDGKLELSSHQKEVLESTDGNFTTGVKTVKEADLSITDDGKTRVASTGQEISIKSIDHIETVKEGKKTKGVAYFKVVDTEGNESVVSSKDVEYGNESDAILYESFAQMGIAPAYLNDFLDNFNEADFDPANGNAAMQYTLGYEEAVRYGWVGLEGELEKGAFAPALNEKARRHAYETGASAVRASVESQQAVKDTAVEERKASGEGKAKAQGTLHFDNSKTKGRTALQNAGVGLAKRLTSLGIDVYIYESHRDAKGNWVDDRGQPADNGFYRASDGSIHIDLNAGERGQGIMVFTLAHELTHFMRHNAPKEFKTFADLLVKWYGKKGESVSDLIHNRMAEENLSWDDAYEEVIARSCESFLTDSNIADRIIEIQETDKGLWNIIKEKVLKFLDWMRSKYLGYTPESAEGQFFHGIKNEIDELYDAFSTTLASASETFQWVGSIAEAKTNAETLSTAGITVDADTGSAVMHSVRYAPKTQAEIDKVAKALSESVGVSIDKAKAWVKSETSLSSIILDPSNAMFLDYEADDRYEAIKKNAEYPQGTVDFSNLCKKRREFTALLDKLQKEHPNRIITAAEMEKIRQVLIEENVEVACGLCYVEERRQLLGEIAQGFIDGYKNGTLKGSISKELDAKDNYVPTIYDLITYDGYRALTTEHPSVAKAFQKFNNACGMQAGRLIEGIAEYKRDILKWSQKKVDFVNSVGGLRVFSFSDFEATHLIDLVQVIQDCASKGVMIQAYTKVPAFANAVKDTNMKVNRSLIANGTGIKYENGRMVLDLDPVEGIDINDKDFFDSSDSKNIGNVLVGISNEQIRLAMKTSFVDYIIPFHTGLKGDILKAKKIDHWDNYKNFQTDKEFHPEKVTYKKDGSIKSDGWVVAESQINVYVDVIQAAEAEGKPIKNKVDFVNKFLAVAKEKGLKPRFWNFLDMDANGEYTYTEGYHKFLVDFKLFDQEGNILPQEPVVPVFDDALNARILNEYVAGKKAPVSRDAVYDRLDREVINGDIISNDTALADVEVKHSRRYWYPNMSAAEISYVRRVAKSEVQKSDKFIDNGNKWLYNTKNDTPYFALYSTADVNNPTVMYACKGNRANKENLWFMDFIAELEMVENGRDDLRRKTIDEVLASFGYALGKSGVRSGNATNGRSGQNVGVHSSASGFRPSAALLICLRNIAETQKKGQQGEVKKSSRRVTAEQDAQYLELAKDPVKNEKNLRKMVQEVALESGVIRTYRKKDGFVPQSYWHYSRTGGGFTSFNVPAWFSESRNYATNRLQPTIFGTEDLSKDSKEYYLTQPGNGLVVPNIYGRQAFKGSYFIEKYPFLDGVLDKEELYGTNKLVEDEVIRNVLIKNGISNVYANEDGYKVCIVLGSSQIKTADPVTYDDNGNVIPLSERFDSSNDGYRYSKRQKAPTFYSYMGVVVDGLKDGKYDAASVINMLKGKGVKDEEIKWSGIETWLEGKKSVTKAELQEFIAGSQLEIGEEMSASENNARKELNRLWQEEIGGTVDEYLGGEPLNEDTLADIFDDMGKKGLPIPFIETQLRMIELARNAESNVRWGQYKLDGGSNYREIVFTMPNSTYSNNAMKAHWGVDAEGVLVHARIQDFVDADGNKMLFVEELQSDWHNAGHKGGYRVEGVEDKRSISNKMHKASEEFFDSPIANVVSERISKIGYEGAGVYAVLNYLLDGVESMNTTLDMLERRGVSFTSAEVSEIEWYARRYEKLYHEWQTAPGELSAPDAPFKDTYHEYVMKRLLRMAAEEGYDSIGWTPAQIQSDRWSDEFAEGYRIEYDQEIPKFLRKYGKKWGATVGKTYIDGVSNSATNIDVDSTLDNLESPDELLLEEMPEEFGDGALSGYDYNGVEVWSMPITNSMKDSVLYEGQVMYSKRGGTSNRSLLANALEGATQHESEARRLAEYKEKIDLINAEEKKLRETRERIAELSFAKGPKDTVTLKNLQATATRIANRINTYDKQLLNLEATAPLKAVLEREKAMVKKREKQKAKKAVADYREKAVATQKEIMSRYQESRKKGIESRNKTEMRHKIKSIVSELNQLLLHGSKDKHVMIGLQKATADALSAINMDTVNAEKRLAEIQKKIDASNDPDKIAELQQTYDRIELQGENMMAKLTALKNAYEDIKDSTDPLVANAYHPEIEERIKNLRKEVGDTPLREMSLDQLEFVYDTYKMVLHTIRTANKAFIAKKKESIATLANAVMEEVHNVGGTKQMSVKSLDWLKKFYWNGLKPVYAFKAIGSDTLSEMFDGIRAGEDTWAVDVSEAKDYFKEVSKKHNYGSWEFGKQYKFQSKTGREFSLSLEQMMSLYAYSKRKQADEHLDKGGFVFDEAIEVKKKKHGVPITYTVNVATSYNISKDTLGEIVSNLTDEQKAFVDEMQTYLSDVMGEKGNEVSLEMYGVKLFKEKFYFPLKSAKQFMYEQNEVAGEVRLKNSGFSKETVAHANNPIILSNFMDVWANHVNDMSMYHSFVLALEDFNRVYNYKTPSVANLDTESVKMYIQNAYGTQPNQYIKQLLTDLNGGARTDPSADFITKMTGLFKKSAVFASASVVIQQPSSIARATALIDTKYFATKLSVAQHKAEWAEVKKYAPVAIIKEMGYFDTHMGRSTTDFIKAKDYDGVADKMKGLVTDSGYRDEVLSKAPAVADELSWCYIWNAVKKEIADTTDLEVGSEEFLQKCGERFTEVVVKTQVYDSVLSRSAMMRSKDTGMKMATAFMAEPTTSINMIADAIIQGKRGKKGAGKQIGAVLASLVLNAILVSFVYAGRDDDEEKTYAEKYVGTLTSELIDSFNPLTMIPFAKDMVSIAQGYDVERSDMAVISDLFTAFKKLSNDNLPAYRKVEDFGGAIASIFGLPAKNVMRDVRGVYNTISSFINGKNTTWYGIFQAVKESVTGEADSNSKQLYDAITSGNPNRVEEFKGKYKNESTYESAVRKALRENDPRVREALKIRVMDGVTDKYHSIRQEIIAEGNFEQSIVNDALMAEYNYFMGKIEDAADLLKSGEKGASDDIIRDLKKKYNGTFSQDDILKLVKKRAGLLK